MALKSVVELYRRLDKPIYNEENRTFTCTCNYTNDIKSDLENVDLNYATFHSISINNEHFEIDSLPDPDNVNIYLEVRVHSNSPVSFFKDIESFFQRASNTIKNCQVPSEYYFVDDDYYSGDEIANIKIDNLKNLYNLVDCLSTISEHKNGNQLVFFSKIDDKVITLPLNIKLRDTTLLDYSVELQPFSELCSNEQDDLLANEKRTIFKETLFDFLCDKIESESFSYLVKNFEPFKKKFLQNLRLYLGRFSFQKIRQEVANAEIDFSGKCSKTLSDIQAKLLGIPVSFAGVVALTKATSGFEILLLVIGLVFVSIILFSTVKVQLSNFNIIKSASKNVFEGFESRYKSYPQTLTDMIKNEKKLIEIQQRKTFWWLIAFLILSLTPAILSILFLVSKIWFSSIAIIFIS